MATSASERKAAERQRKRDAGLYLLPAQWIHPDDRDAVLAYINRKNAKRAI